MTLIAKSGLTIRFPEERWQHIAEQHPELANLQQIPIKPATKETNSKAQSRYHNDETN
jgi:hypothetical protein